MTDKFCKFCGTTHTATAFPLTCESCKTVTWFSPSPVAVNLQPVRAEDGTLGLLIGRRTINPHKGGWNLVGGFIDATDLTAQAAAAREMFEETGFEIDPEDLELVSTFSDGRHFLIFVENLQPIEEAELSKFVPNDECDEIRVIWEAEKLCFDSHGAAAEQWFAVQQLLATGEGLGLFGIGADDESGYEAQDRDDDDWRGEGF